MRSRRYFGIAGSIQHSAAIRRMPVPRPVKEWARSYGLGDDAFRVNYLRPSVRCHTASLNKVLYLRASFLELGAYPTHFFRIHAESNRRPPLSVAG